MSVATISSKGQITLPVEARRAVGMQAGDRVRVRVHDGAIIIEPVLDFLGLKGTLGPALPRAEEIDAMQEAATRHAMGRS